MRIALVGYGKIGERHAQEIGQIGQLVAICDTDHHRLKMAQDRWGVAVFTHTRQMYQVVSSIELVVIATPNGLHACQALEALRAGAHVLIEKPMALKTTDADAIIELANRLNKRVFVVKQNRYNPPVQHLKELIQSGQLGNITSVQVNGFWSRPNAYYNSLWRGTWSEDGGAVYTQFSHFIDVMLWLFGPARMMAGFRANLQHQVVSETDDCGAMLLQFDSGAVGTFQYSVNCFQQNLEGSVLVIGERGTVKIGGQYLNELVHWQVDGVEHPELPPGNPANQYGSYAGSMNNHRLVYANVMAVLERGATPDVSIEDARNTVRFIESFYAQTA